MAGWNIGWVRFGFDLWVVAWAYGGGAWVVILLLKWKYDCDQSISSSLRIPYRLQL